MLIFEKQETEAPLILTIDQEGSGGLTGQTPTVALRDATTLDMYLDWSDFTFKNAGWTTKYQSLSEVERGHYTLLLNPSITTSFTVGMMLAAEYHLDAAGLLKGDDHDLLLFVESIIEIPTDTAALIAALPIGLTPAQAIWLQEIWQILGLDLGNPLTVSKTQRTAGSAISQTIEKDVPLAGSVRVTRI